MADGITSAINGLLKVMRHGALFRAERRLFRHGTEKPWLKHAARDIHHDTRFVPNGSLAMKKGPSGMF